MAISKSNAGTIRRHVSRDGRVSFTCTVRIAGFKAASKTFPTPKDARKWAAETQRMLRDQKHNNRPAVRHDIAQLTWGALISEYLRSPEAQALRSYDGVEQMLAWFVAHYGTTKVLDVNVLLLREAREKLWQGRKSGTVTRYLICARSCWNWGREAGLIPTERRWPEKLMPPQTPGRLRFLNDEEIAAVIAAARAHSPLMHALIVTALASGCRAGELRNLDWSDVDLTHQTLAIRESKTDTPRAVHLGASACEALRELKAQKVRSIGGAVFQGPTGERLKGSTMDARWRLIRAAAGLKGKGVCMHTLRHTTASVMAQGGDSLLMIATQLGHSSLEMVKRYAHLVPGASTPGLGALDVKLSKRP